MTMTITSENTKIEPFFNWCNLVTRPSPGSGFNSFDMHFKLYFYINENEKNKKDIIKIFSTLRTQYYSTFKYCSIKVVKGDSESGYTFLLVITIRRGSIEFNRKRDNFKSELDMFLSHLKDNLPIDLFREVLSNLILSVKETTERASEKEWIVSSSERLWDITNTFISLIKESKILTDDDKLFLKSNDEL